MTASPIVVSGNCAERVARAVWAMSHYMVGIGATDEEVEQDMRELIHWAGVYLGAEDVMRGVVSITFEQLEEVGQ